jgi:hypothetical protein
MSGSAASVFISTKAITTARAGFDWLGRVEDGFATAGGKSTEASGATVTLS